MVQFQYSVETHPHMYPVHTALREAVEALRDAEWDGKPTEHLERTVASLEAQRDAGVDYIPLF